MKSNAIRALACLVLLLWPVISGAQALSVREQALDKARLDLEQAKAETVHLQEQLTLAESKYKAGLETAAEMSEVNARLLAAVTTLRQKEMVFQQLQRLVDLNRKVDVQFQDATIRMAAEALASATGLSVDVDKSVPAEMRLTLQAHSVPFADVIEAVARQTNLMITPGPNGVQLKPWPTLSVNGNLRPVKSPIAPWSEDWGQPPNAPTALLLTSGQVNDALVTGANQPLASSAGSLTSVNRRPSGTDALGVLAVGSARNITPRTDLLNVLPLGSTRIVVAEPGVNGQGASGTWLTIYQIAGSRLKRISSGFHPAPARSRSFHATRTAPKHKHP